MPKKRMFPIDPARMNDVLAARKLTAEDVSKRMGYGKTFMYQNMQRRKVSEACISALDALYGIKYADYKVLPPEPVKAEPEEKPVDPQMFIVRPEIDYDELFKCIYLAAYKAFQKALKEDSGGESD